MRTTLVVMLTLAAAQSVYAGSGSLFNVSGVGTPGQVNFNLCLNGNLPASCQNFNVNALTVTISTTIPNHTYVNAGIKINSGATLEHANFPCHMIPNGYCIFTVSNTAPVTINLRVPDYIIIGAGTAGAVMARKLTDDLKTDVIVLHNGSNQNQDPNIRLSENSVISTLYAAVGAPYYNTGLTIPQSFANNRNLTWSYALPFGGASSVNMMGYARGTTQVYAQWEALNGPYWSTDRILATFNALENYSGLTITPGARGTNGPLPVYQTPTLTQMMLNVFLPAELSAYPGMPLVVDYNDPSVSNGIDPRVQYTQTNAGVNRASSATSFLNNTVIDSNGNGVNGRKLSIFYNVTADNIIWNGNKAVGVNYYENGVLKQLYANKGVIVTAGVKSSTFLQRSGIGASSLLQSLNIPVKYNNPNVGLNLKDQFRVLFIYQTNPSDSPVLPLIQVPAAIITALSATNVGRQLIHYIGNFIAAQNSNFFEVVWLPLVGNSASDPRAFRLVPINPIPGYAVVLFDMIQPVSSGSVEINSKNPFDEPTVDLGLFQSPVDLDNMSSALRVYIRDLTQQLQFIDPQYQMVYPDPTILDFAPLTEAFLLSDVGTDMHFQGTCKMAPLNQGGVVDSTGHVYGVNNLIVADDSIAPFGMDGAPMASAYMIAENVSNIMLGR